MAASSSSFVWTLNKEKWWKCPWMLWIYDLLYLVFLPGLLLRYWGFINDLGLNPINSGHHRTLEGIRCFFFFSICLWLCFAFVPGQFSKRGDNYKVTVSFKPGSRLSFSFRQTQQKPARRKRWRKYKENLLFFLWSARQNGDPY